MPSTSDPLSAIKDGFEVYTLIRDLNKPDPQTAILNKLQVLENLANDTLDQVQANRLLQVETFLAGVKANVIAGLEAYSQYFATGSEVDRLKAIEASTDASALIRAFSAVDNV